MLNPLPYDMSSRHWRLNPIAFTLTFLFKKSMMQKSGKAPTFIRLCISHHLMDLQLLSLAAILTIAFVLCLMKHFWNEGGDHLTHVAALGGAATLVLSWAYQTGSKRLGVIDLFASEISAICRVCYVSEFPKATLDQETEYHKNNAPSGKTDFAAKEEYALVFEQSLKDIQPLSFGVIKSVTSFYIYRKTMIDLMRKIAATEQNPSRDKIAVKMIYTQFLMYESARYAIADLIEYAPERAESLNNILTCEMYLYPFLVDHFGSDQNDPRYKRLRLRKDEYKEWVNALKKEIRTFKDEQSWARAKATLSFMKLTYRNLDPKPNHLDPKPNHLDPEPNHLDPEPVQSYPTWALKSRFTVERSRIA